MYWQVYLHKAAISAEYTMVNILRRARALFEAGEALYLDDTLGFFFRESITPEDLNPDVLARYIRLDDNDIEFALKKWQDHPDPVLSDLCRRILTRRLLKLRICEAPVPEAEVAEKRAAWARKKGLSEDDAGYYVFAGKVSNQAYFENSREPILIWFKNGGLKDLATASDMGNIHALANPVIKDYLAMPEEMA